MRIMWRAWRRPGQPPSSTTLPRLPQWQTRLRDALADAGATYDLVVLDSAPGLGVLPFAALVAGDCVLIAATPAYLTLRALGHVFER